jgi:hypothetical protein
MSDKRTPKPDDTDRNRGILTQADREYLLGEKDLKSQSEREARQRIRDRLENALLDISLLNHRISENDREMVADSVLPDTEEGNFHLFDGLNLLFEMTLDTSEDADQALTRFERENKDVIESVIKRVKDNILIDINVDIDMDERDPDIEELVKKYENDKETLDELMYLQNEGAIESDKKYFNHLFEHMWDKNNTFGISVGDSVKVIDPVDYDSVEEFRQACSEAMGQFTMEHDVSDEDD